MTVDAPGTDGDRLAQLIGRRIGYYAPVFERLERDRRVIAWNWCAFAFGPLWAAYRRMYLLAIGSVVLAIAIHYAPALWPDGAALSNTLVWGSLLFGLFGNRLLWAHTRRRIAAGGDIQPGPNRTLLWCLIGLYALAIVFRL